MEEALRYVETQRIIEEEVQERVQHERPDDEEMRRGKVKEKRVLKDIKNVQRKQHDRVIKKGVNAKNKSVEAKKGNEMVISSTKHDRAKKKLSSVQNSKVIPIIESKGAAVEDLHLNESPQLISTSFQDDSNFIGGINCTGIEAEEKSRNTIQSIQHDQALIIRKEEQSTKGPHYIPRDQSKVQNLIMQYENRFEAVGNVQRTLGPLLSSTSIQQDYSENHDDETCLKEEEPQFCLSNNCSFFSGLSRFMGGQKPKNCFMLDADHL